MALSELDMMNLWAKQLTGYKSQWGRLFGFGYAVEAEVRKSDDVLIRRLVEALVDLVEAGEDAWGDERPCVRIGKEEITAALARLQNQS
ncbi:MULTISPECIES: hypothetical protein [unclassified Acidovorax]|uniref:hypothetical protein n=1 Tax=unclassified Acidovorax TaxID=2684926 RepID=UPI000B403D9D|nr:MULTISPECIES: hypothetical protein [unclassified Acidovorax]